MKALLQDFELWSDAAFHETVRVTLDGRAQDFTGWVFQMPVADSYLSTQPKFMVGVTAGANGVLTLDVPLTTVDTLFAGVTDLVRICPYVLKAKPNVAYPIRLMYGRMFLRKGLPAWQP